MPRDKAKQDPGENSAENPMNESGPTTGKVSKMHAVRQAVASLGYDAKPPVLDDFIQKTYGLTIPHNMISSYKSQLKATAEKSGKRRGRPAAAESRPKEAGGNFSMKDIQDVKSLAGRLGIDKLRLLVDVLA